MRAGLIVALLLPAAAWAGAWTTPGGTVWAKASWFRQTTGEWYTDIGQPILLPDNQLGLRPAGSRQPYRFDGEYSSTALFLDLRYGLTDALEVGLQVPWFDQSFDDDTRIDPPSDRGLSDLRLMGRWRLLQAPLLLTAKVAVKTPTGEFRNEDGLIPVGEGQWDVDLVIQAGRSLWPAPAYVSAEAGYRIRAANHETARDPGDEWLVLAEAGVAPHPATMLMLKFEGLYGAAGRDFGLRNEALIKRITYLTPTLAWTVRDVLTIEGAVRVSLAGRNHPAGPQYVLGLSTSIDARR